MAGRERTTRGHHLACRVSRAAAPVELLDAHDVVVAKSGDLISFGGGAGPVQPGRACMLGQKDAFYVMSNVSGARHH